MPNTTFTSFPLHSISFYTQYLLNRLLKKLTDYIWFSVKSFFDSNTLQFILIALFSHITINFVVYIFTIIFCNIFQLGFNLIHYCFVMVDHQVTKIKSLTSSANNVTVYQWKKKKLRNANLPGLLVLYHLTLTSLMNDLHISLMLSTMYDHHCNLIYNQIESCSFNTFFYKKRVLRRK